MQTKEEAARFLRETTREEKLSDPRAMKEAIKVVVGKAFDVTDHQRVE